MRINAAVLMLAGGAACAGADIVDMSFSGVGSGVNVRVTAGTRSFNTFAGQLMHDVVSGTGLGEHLLGEQVFYCTDIYETVSRSPSPFVIASPTEVPDTSPMSGASVSALANIFGDADGLGFEPDAPSAYAAAFQLAVWEIVSDYDPLAGAASLNIESGWFRATGSGGGQLGQEVLANLGALFRAVEEDRPFGGMVYALRSDQYQDQLFAVAGDRAIPAPGATAMLGGLLLVTGRRRR